MSLSACALFVCVLCQPCSTFIIQPSICICKINAYASLINMLLQIQLHDMRFTFTFCSHCVGRGRSCNIFYCDCIGDFCISVVAAVLFLQNKTCWRKTTQWYVKYLLVMYIVLIIYCFSGDDVSVVYMCEVSSANVS